MLENRLRDLRYAARGLRRSPAFTFVAVLTLGLGIGANSAIFTLVEAALLRGLPYRDASRLVHVWEETAGASARQVSYPDYTNLRDRSRAFDAVAGYAFDGFTLTGAWGTERIAGGRVSATFFPVLGVEPLLGRSFRPDEDRLAGRRDVVLMSHGLWQRRFGADPSVVGRAIALNGESFTVIGVLPKAFHFAPLGEPELYATLSPSQAAVERRLMHWMWAIARLRPGASLEQANADLASIAVWRASEDPRWHKDTGLRAVPLRDAIVGPIRPLLLGLFAAVAAVLLIACVNVANMMLARATARQREVGIRVALGAGRGRLVGQLLTESALVALLGGALGLSWAGLGVRALVAAIPAAQRQALPYLKDLSVDGGVAAFTFAVCLLTAFGFGIVPALRAARGDVSDALKDAARGSTGKHRLRGMLVVGEISLALMLLATAGLLTRSLHRLLNVSPGFETGNLLTARVAMPARAYDTPEKQQAFFKAWTERVASLPGVASVALVDRLPLLGFGNSGTPSIVGRPAADAGAPDAQLRTVSLDYFRVMGLPLRAGRLFAEADRYGAPRVVMVNEACARQVFGALDPLGQSIQFAFMQGQPPLEVIGVVGNETVGDLDAGVRPVIYFPWLQDSDVSMSALIRTKASPGALVASLRAETQRLEPEALVAGARSMEELIADSRSAFLRRYPLLILGAFAALALALACVGTYGVMSYSVGQRTNEIGIRMALGADRTDVLALVLREGLALALGGVAVGVTGALVVARLVSSLLFETAPGDPLVLGAAASLLGLVAFLACYVPARRASRVDPLTAIRCQ